MSQLSKVLEKRIQELTASIDAQKTELAAYERVLHMESSKGNGASGSEPVSEDETAPEPSRKKRGRPKSVNKAASPASAPSGAEASSSTSIPNVEYAGNKTNMVVEIVKAYGSQGATPKDVDAVFTAKSVDRSKNLIYNTLSYLVAQKKLQRKDGRYFGPSGAISSAPAKKSAAPSDEAPAKTKRRLSPEGLKRIKDALKRRWAAKHAADAGASAPRPVGRPAKKRA